MDPNFYVSTIFLIFTGAAVFSTIALFTRQSMLIAYIALGILLGPYGMRLLKNPDMVAKVGDIGIIFLLFLLGLNLPLQKFYKMLKKMSMVGIVSSVLFLLVGYGIAWLFHFPPVACIIIGAAMMFSSTIIGIKLLPTTILHHQHTGEVMISVLLLQDLVAIFVLLLMHSATVGGFVVSDVVLVVVGFPLTLVFAYLFERFILSRLFASFSRIKEYMFLLAIAWCLLMSELANHLHLSAEIGAFIAGISLAASPLSTYIAESLKPLRDFFLVMFFFSVGAGFNLNYLPTVIIPAMVMTAVMILLKPAVYRYLLRCVEESKQVSWEVGVRLGQISEFSLIIAYVALASKLIDARAAYLIQATAILTFAISSYWVVFRYPTPMGNSKKMRRD